MLKERRIERHQLPFYLRVSNRYTGKSMGCLGNISENGLMLISGLPVLVGAEFQLRLQVPCERGLPSTVDVNATCLWCHEDETPGSYDSGFTLTESPAEYSELIKALRRYFSFHHLEASA
ncbi:PilZ domain-containing protein [Pseudomonas caspiana]